MALRELVLRSPNGWCYRHQLERAPFDYLASVIPNFTGELEPDRTGLGPIGLVVEIAGIGRLGVANETWAASWASIAPSNEIAWARSVMEERFMVRAFAAVTNPKRKRGDRGPGARSLPDREVLAEAMVLHATGASQRSAALDAIVNFEARTGQVLPEAHEARLRKQLERELKRVRPLPSLTTPAES